MTDEITRDELEAVFDDKMLDVTERIIEYDTGKVFECDCGQDIGVKHSKAFVRCASCGVMCIDSEHDERESPIEDEAQQSLGKWA